MPEQNLTFEFQSCLPIVYITLAIQRISSHTPSDPIIAHDIYADMFFYDVFHKFSIRRLDVDDTFFLLQQTLELLWKDIASKIERG